MEIKVKSMKPETIVEIPIGAGFYKMLQDLFHHYYGLLDPEKAVTLLVELQSRDPETIVEEHVLTLLSLLYEIEKQAELKGFMEIETVTVPDLQDKK